ncbi:uncharacterized protein [Miscanthus floridulus]|uniref:uncharacterized protein n=1 Tax=Miscanthus floridulus TaxID=154761 RepID=UPI00345AE397
MAPGQSQQDNNPSTEYKLKKYLLLLATLVVAVTYVAGLNLPGGVWQDDTKDGHLAGDLILLDTHYGRYLTFYYCNATAFAASVVVCLLLLILQEGKNGVCETVLRVVMVLDLLGLMGAYAAGSCRDAFTTIYSTLVMSVVLAYVVLAFSLYIISKCKDGKQQPKEDHESQSREEQHEVASSEVLMLLATFVVTITYGAGLSPPGGFWSNTQEGHRVSLPILQDQSSARYQAFFVCNSTAFVASLLIIMLLLDKRLKKELSVRSVALYGLVVVALFGLVGAYAAGSCREIDNTIYVVSLIGAVLAYIFLQVAITKASQPLLQNQRSFYVLARTHRGQDDVGLEKAHDLVILLATLVASITYQAGLDPPGGLWPDNRDGHKVGDPVLLTTHPQRYKVFFYSNSASFVASLVVILMVKCKFLVMRRTLEAAMLADLFGLIAAYAAGCCRDVSTSIYVVALAGAVLVYVVIHIIFFTLDKDKHGDADEVDSRREVLLLLAILAATVTYQAGLTPPGGFWSADDKFGHRAGFPVLLDNYPGHYRAFFYCNATSFMASVALIVLLVNPNLYRPGIRCYAFFVCMVVGLFGLMGAYAAGSSRQLRTSIYVLVLFALVFTCVTSWVLILLIRRLMEHHNKGDGPSVGDAGVGRTDADASPEQDDYKEKRKKLREYLMLLGVLAASVAYQSGLKPPGGLWQDNSDGHSASNSILHDIDKSRYHAFFYSNSTSFMASIVVIVLLLPYGHDELPLRPLHMAILLDLVGLLVAYAAGSTRDWEMSRNVIALVIPLLVYIASYALYTWYRRTKCSDSEVKKVKHGGTFNDVETLS